MISDTERRRWSDFDTACKDAEAEYNQAVKRAEGERDQVINLPGANWQAGDRITAAAEARYGHKEQVARDERDKKCKDAEQVLTTGLDELEAEERRVKKLFGTRWSQN
jgi:hypothetical protein